MSTITEIREQFAQLYRRHESGQKVEVAGTLEIIGSSITVDPTEDTIFGAVNWDYVSRELQWYGSQSLSVNDIPGGPPKIWRDVAASDGTILSNYGYLLLSASNGDQFKHVVEHLRREPEGRRAVAVYTNPFVHDRWNEDGRRDFICTNTVGYYLRDGRLNVIVNMRSNDAVHGFRNDLAWQRYAQELVCDEIDAMPGTIIWQAASLHIYQRHYRLIEHFVNTGEFDIELSRQQ